MLLPQATTRRNMESVNQVFGNKLAILGGDFLLSRASVSLARLRNLEVHYYCGGASSGRRPSALI
jgi:hexaprenyl-diphosphate synthase